MRPTFCREKSDFHHGPVISGVLFLQFVLLLVFVVFRYLDADEGIFLHAARLVREGLTPYHDFFYMQMPYLPYLLAPSAGGGGWVSLYAARLICVVLSIGTALIIYYAAKRETRLPLVAVAALFLFAANGFTITWHSVVKTSVFADFFGLAAAVLFVETFRRNESRTVLLLIAGALFGIAFNIRLTHIVLLGVSVLMAITFRTKEKWSRRIRDAAMLTGGAVVVSSGSIYLLALDPYTFYYHNIGFRADWGFVTSPMHLGERFLTWLRFLAYPQVMPIVILAGISGWLLARGKVRMASEPLSPTVAWIIYGAALTVLYLAISPTALQYFGQTMPFLILACIPALVRFEHLICRRWVCASAAAAYLIAMLPFVWIFVFTARAKDAPYRLDSMRETVDVIRSHTAPDERVLSFSPHLPFLAERQAVLGAEVRGIAVLEHASQAGRQASRLLTREDVEDLIADGVPALVVHEPAYISGLTDPLHRHYRPVAELHGYMIFRRIDGTTGDRNAQHQNAEDM